MTKSIFAISLVGLVIGCANISSGQEQATIGPDQSEPNGIIVRGNHTTDNQNVTTAGGTFKLPVAGQNAKIDLIVPDVKVVFPEVKIDIPVIEVAVPAVDVKIPTVMVDSVAKEDAGHPWLKYLFTFIGGLIIGLIPICYSEFSRSRKAKEVIEKHLDPILKAADQLLGQIVSLSRKDFESIYADGEEAETERKFVLYLFAQFWARLEILKKESLHTKLTKDEKGKLLMQFIRTLKAKKNRITSRAHQQTIGESIMVASDNSYEIKTFFQFQNEDFPENNQGNQILELLDEKLINTRIKNIRQQILVYGVILHAMTDSLDPKHEIIMERRPFPNKLTAESRRDLEWRVFKTYLPMVEDDKYWNKK